jgi:hypothetical protein
LSIANLVKPEISFAYQRKVGYLMLKKKCDFSPPMQQDDCANAKWLKVACCFANSACARN